MATSLRGTQRAPVPDGFVEIGYIRKAHGIRGEVQLRLHNPTSDALAGVSEITLIDDQGALHSRRLLGGSGEGELWRVRLRGVDDRETAEGLRGCRVLIREEELPELEEGEFYHFELIGLRAVDAAGQELGKIVDVFEGGGHDLYTVRTAEGVEVLVPAVAAFVAAVDLEAGEVRLEEFESLLDAAR
jgi:16S rRNA processing protein RimM